jgi:NADH-quinone oxidoreductase subunit C
VPDAAELERIAAELRAPQESGQPSPGGPVLASELSHGRAALLVEAHAVGAVLERLRERGFRFLASLHGVDYYPQEPRFGVLYELLDMERVERLTVKVRLAGDAPALDSVCDRWPTANHQEREVYDMFGVRFRGHPDLRRILMPEDYEGHPQRRDFPLGGEPVAFTYNESEMLSAPK